MSKNATVRVACVCSILTSVGGEEMVRTGRDGCIKCGGDGYVNKRACRTCDGTGKIGSRCPDCRGIGWRDMDNMEF